MSGSLFILTWALLLTALSFLAFTSTGRDDPYFTYWISDQLRQAQVNGYNGTPFEQTSSLFHAGLVAATSGLLRQPAVVAAKVVEAVVSIATLTGVGHLLQRRHSLKRTCLAMTATAAFPLFAYWSWGGLETSTVVLLCLGQTLLLAHQQWRSLALVNGLYALLRPEAVLVLPLQTVLIHSRSRAQQLILASLLPLAAAALTRLLLFGRPLPATVSAKALWASGIGDRLTAGLTYLAVAGTGSLFLGIPLLLAAVVTAAWLWRSGRGWPQSVVSLALAQFLVVAVGGGDWMEMGRFFLAPFTLLLVALLVECEWPALQRSLSVVVLAFSAGFYLITAWSSHAYARLRLTPAHYFPLLGQAADPVRPFWIKGHRYQALHFECQRPFEWVKRPSFRDCIFLDAVLEAQGEQHFRFRPGDVLLSYQAGMVPYYLLKRYPFLRFVDPIGLASGERTSDPDLAFPGSALSEPLIQAYLERFRPAFVFDLGGYKDLFVQSGYVPVVSIRIGSHRQPEEPGSAEIFYVRSDRYHHGS